MARECHDTSRQLVGQFFHELDHQYRACWVCGQVAYPSKYRRSCSHNEHNRKFSDLYPDTPTGLRKALEAVQMIEINWKLEIKM